MKNPIPSIDRDDVTVIKLKYLKAYPDRHGRMRYYVRRRGFKDIAIPGEALTDGWMQAYSAAIGTLPKPVPPASSYKTGSVQWALTQWYASAKFKRLEPQTRHKYKQLMERELKAELHKPIVRLEDHHVEEWMDDRADTPGAALVFLKRLKTFLRFCAKRKIVDTNVAQYVEPPEYESEGHLPWDEDDATKYEARWPINTKQRLAYAIMAYTGQRVSDAAKMGRQDERHGGTHLYVVQAKLRKGKKRTRLIVPIHPKLRETLDANGVDGRMIYMVTEYGKPFSVKGLSQHVSRWAAEAGLDAGKTSHGLRKLAGSNLAEAGCSEKQIMAMLGLSSFEEAALYTAAANQKKLADDAMRMMLENEKGAQSV